MPEPDTPANPAEEPVKDNPTPEPDKGGSTTPEEVAKVLKSSGIDITDAEEGDDPDAEEKPAEPVVDEEEPAEEEAEPEPEKEEPAKPAEPVAADEDKYSFEVTDANNVTFKIAVGAKMEDILSEFEPKNNGQILDILNQLQKLEGQKASDEQQMADDTAKEERRTRASEMLEGWQAEAKVLQGDKRIPEGDDGEKRINQVYKFMADENDNRMKAGKPTLNSFEDALDKLENKEARDAKVAADKAAKDRARENGSKVGGASAPASSGSPVYKAGSARNANDAIRSMGLLE